MEALNDMLPMFGITDHMNIFRLTADVLHLIAMIVLFLKIWITKDCAGISGKSQILFSTVYVTRYMDLVMVYISSYNTLMKLVFIILSYATVFLIYVKYNHTYDRANDKLRIEFLVLPAFLLAAFVNHSFTILEIAWTFSIYLESVAILPQLILIWNTRKVKCVVGFYLFAVGLYRSLYILNWAYRYQQDNYYDSIAVPAGVVQTAILIGFLFIYGIATCLASLKNHTHKLKPLLAQLQTSESSCQSEKCNVPCFEKLYADHVISSEGVKPDPKKIEEIKNFSIPNSKDDVKELLNLASCYQEFINNFSKISKPLKDLLKKDSVFDWGPTQQDAFDKLRNIICSEPVLHYPDFDKPFVITTEASDFALGAVLSQGTIGKDLPVAYASRSLNDTEINYSTMEKELLAIIFAVEHFGSFIDGRKFTLVTDYKLVVSLDDYKNPTSNLLQWQTRLNKYNCEIIHKSGEGIYDTSVLPKIPCPIHTKESSVHLQINDD